MQDKKIVKKLVIISIIILIIGAIFGLCFKILILNSIEEQNIPSENTSSIGGDYSGIIGTFGNIFAVYVEIGIFILSVIIDLIIWIVYGIISFIHKRKAKK